MSAIQPTFDPEDLLSRLRYGDAVSDEVAKQVADALSDPGSPDDPYTLMHILGKSRRVEYRKLVEKFLQPEADPWLARIALIVLCNMWGFTDQYLPELERFARSVYWDIDQDARVIAVSILGEHLRVSKDPPLLLLLITIAQDDSEWVRIRESAVVALARATGYSHREIPPPSIDELSQMWSSEVVEKARARLQSESM